MTTTVLLTRRRCLQDIEGLGEWFSAIDALAVGSFTLNRFADSNAPTSKYKNKIVHRPAAASAADTIRITGALTIASGLVAHTGANYSDTTVTSESLELWNHLDYYPDLHWIRDMATVLLQLKFRCHVPLRHGPDDADMQANNTTSWTAQQTATLAKQTTAGEVAENARSLSSTGDGANANGGARSTLMRLWQSGLIYCHGIGKADTGTAAVRILDNSATTLQTITFTQEDWVKWFAVQQVSASVEGVRYDLLHSGVSDQVDWQYAWFVKADDYDFRFGPTGAPIAWIDEDMDIKGVSVAKYRQAGGEASTWRAAPTYELLVEGDDYWIERAQSNAITGVVHILKPALMSEDLRLEVDCPYSKPYGVASAFSAETDTMAAPLQLAVAQYAINLGTKYPARFPGVKEWGTSTKMTFLDQLQPVSKAPIRSTNWGRAWAGA